MKRIFLKTVPSTLVILASKFDGIKLSEPCGATRYQEGPMSFETCGFPGILDSSLRVLIFRTIEGLEYVCHARFSFRPCSASPDFSPFERDFEELSRMLQGTGIRTIDSADQQTFADFYRAQDEAFKRAFRSPEGEIKLTEDVVRLRAA